MAVIQIGTAKSLKEPDNFGVNPDDRQELIKCVNGVFPSDGGNYPEGDIFSLTAIFSPAAWETVKAYWIGRTKVTVIDAKGVSMEDMRVVVKKYEHVKRFIYWQVNIELWRV